jgi:hypothetical protein
VSLTAGSDQSTVGRLIELIEELLEAHCDTVCLADNAEADPAWPAHLSYLRDLHRVGLETLARVS